MIRSLLSIILLVVTTLTLGGCGLLGQSASEVAQAETSVKIGSSQTGEFLEIIIDGQKKTITLWADAKPADVTFEWSLTGSGTLTSQTDASIQYIAPQSLDGDEEVLISVTVRDQSGHEATDRITIRLLSSPPVNALTDTPIVIPSPTDTLPLTPPVTSEHRVLYRGSVFLIFLTESEIIVENISSSPVSIRVSWDEQDPNGLGVCPDFPEDCFIDNWVEPGEKVQGKIKNHISVQVWAWGTEGGLVDSKNLPITP